MSLNILTDFCNTWWIWWILPFIIGCTLGVVVMQKWKRMYLELTQEMRVNKNNLKKAEEKFEISLKEQKDLKGQLVIQRGKIRELETALKNK